MTGRVLVALVLTAAALAACGGDGEEGAERLSKQEYIAQADAICRKANARELEVAGSRDPGDDVAALRPEVLAGFVAAGRQALVDLRKLEAPEGDEARLGEFVAALGRLQDVHESELRARRAGRPAPPNAREEYETAYADVASAAGSYGIAECQGVGT